MNRIGKPVHAWGAVAQGTTEETYMIFASRRDLEILAEAQIQTGSDIEHVFP
jgi:hypothetical protein